MSFTTERQSLRETLRKQRQTLTPHQREMASLHLAERLLSHAIFQNSQHIAAYMAIKGEIDPIFIMQMIWQQGKTCYLPQLGDERHLKFSVYCQGDAYNLNRYGIAEPAQHGSMIPEALDLVLLPLVGFDVRGNRLGMGGGYYDRTFAFRRESDAPKKPYLIGLAYEFQRCELLVAESWDVPLDAVVTEKEFFICSAD